MATRPFAHRIIRSANPVWSVAADLRLARTIADIDCSDDIQYHHLSEAINYRMLDRDAWK